MKLLLTLVAAVGKKNVAGKALGSFPGGYSAASRWSAGFIDPRLPVMSGLFCARFFPQAGDKHYHPSCARCSRCNQMFTEGEEMYLQGERIYLYSLFLTTKGFVAPLSR